MDSPLYSNDCLMRFARFSSRAVMVHVYGRGASTRPGWMENKTVADNYRSRASLPLHKNLYPSSLSQIYLWQSWRPREDSLCWASAERQCYQIHKQKDWQCTIVPIPIASPGQIRLIDKVNHCKNELGQEQINIPFWHQKTSCCGTQLYSRLFWYHLDYWGTFPVWRSPAHRSSRGGDKSPLFASWARSQEPIWIRLTDVHKDNRVTGDMIALTCDIFGSDVRQADRKDRSEAEDLIKWMQINTTNTYCRSRTFVRMRLTSLTNALIYGNRSKSARTGRRSPPTTLSISFWAWHWLSGLWSREMTKFWR